LFFLLPSIVEYLGCNDLISSCSGASNDLELAACPIFLSSLYREDSGTK